MYLKCLMKLVCYILKMHPAWSLVLLQVLLPNPTASCSARPHAATSKLVYIYTRTSTHTHTEVNIGLIWLVVYVVNLPIVLFFSGSGNSLAESGRSESRATLRSPREERTDVLQLRKVKRHPVLLIFPSLAILTQLTPFLLQLS